MHVLVKVRVRVYVVVAGGLHKDGSTGNVAMGRVYLVSILSV